MPFRMAILFKMYLSLEVRGNVKHGKGPESSYARPCAFEECGCPY